MRLPAFTGWGASKDLPRFAGRTFRERFLESDSHVPRSGMLLREQNIKLRQDHLQSNNMQEHTLSGHLAPALQKLEQFTQELALLGGYVYQAKNPTQQIIQLLQARGINKIHLEPDTLDESLLKEANIDFTYVPDPALLAGVTKAICGLADTGSVLQTDGEGSPLHASLLPEIHIAVLSRSDILPSLPDAMKLPQVRDANAVVFITGPSRTADIEMTLTIGVHGPKEIHVFVDDSNPG
jgi:L-lactate utilization protein LutC